MTRDFDQGLRDLAISLAFAGQEDDEAVGLLREAAGPNGEGSLTLVAESLTIGPGAPIDEFDDWDRAYRLLRAAVVNGPVEPVSVQRAAFFEEVRSLEESSLEAGWARLVVALPVLLDLEADMTRVANTLGDANSTDSERASARRVLSSGRLNKVIGPRAEGATDPLVRTKTALALADKCLCRILGIELGERYIGPDALVTHEKKSNKKVSSIGTSYRFDETSRRWSPPKASD